MRLFDTSMIVASSSLAALLVAGCAQRADSEDVPQAGAGGAAAEDAAAPQEDAVQLEPAYPPDVSAEGLSAEEAAQHRELGEHSHEEDGATHTHEGGEEHDDHDHDDQDDHEHDDGHSH